jgi:prepilin-type N-terminal cleavage/methylation domain-containing protein
MRQSANRFLPSARAHSRGFTIIELLIVMAIIVILASLVLGVAGYANRKGATSRAEAEIKALEAACESYKADNGIYPRNADTDALDAAATTAAAYNPAGTTYPKASVYLYGQLSGDYDNSNPAASTNYNFKRDGNEGKGYMEFKPNMLAPQGGTGTVTNIRDPFGNSYGYSTAYAAWQEPPNSGAPPQKGYNPTFDLWSTAGTTSASDSAAKAKWIKNW